MHTAFGCSVDKFVRLRSNLFEQGTTGVCCSQHCSVWTLLGCCYCYETLALFDGLVFVAAPPNQSSSPLPCFLRKAPQKRTALMGDLVVYILPVEIYPCFVWCVELLLSVSGGSLRFFIPDVTHTPFPTSELRSPPAIAFGLSIASSSLEIDVLGPENETASTPREAALERSSSSTRCSEAWTPYR